MLHIQLAFNFLFKHETITIIDYFENVTWLVHQSKNLKTTFLKSVYVMQKLTYIQLRKKHEFKTLTQEMHISIQNSCKK